MNFNTCNKVNLFIVGPFTFAHKAATTIVFLTKLQAKKTNQTVGSVLITTCTYDTAKTKQKTLTGNLTQCTLYTVFTVYHRQEYLTMVRNSFMGICTVHFTQTNNTEFSHYTHEN